MNGTKVRVIVHHLEEGQFACTVSEITGYTAADLQRGERPPWRTSYETPSYATRHEALADARLFARWKGYEVINETEAALKENAHV